jgi:hypothetical protein
MDNFDGQRAEKNGFLRIDYEHSEVNLAAVTNKKSNYVQLEPLKPWEAIHGIYLGIVLLKQIAFYYLSCLK